MITSLNRKDKEFKFLAIVTIIGAAILSLLFLKDYLTQANGHSVLKYSLLLSTAFFGITCIAILGLKKGLRSLVFLALSSYLLLIIIIVTFL